MTLQQLHYLMEVYRTGSVSRAAKNLYLAQSSLSASISAMEKELGFSIFIRSKNGMMPTVQGAHVIQQAARICESYQSMTAVATTNKAHIRISAPSYTPLNNAFLALVNAYSSSAYFTLDCFSTLEIAKRLSSLQLDAAVLINHTGRMLSVETLLSSKGLQWKKLAEMPVTVRVAPKHRLYNESVITPADLENELFIDDLNDPLLDNEYLKGIIRLHRENTISVKDPCMADQLLSEGVGFAIGLDHQSSDSTVRCIPLKDVCYTLSIVTNPKFPTAEAVERYISLIEEELKKPS